MQIQPVQVEGAIFQAPFVLSLDVGTTSTRALLFDARGVAIPQQVSQLQYRLTTSADGEVSVDADTLLAFVARTIDELLERAGPLARQIGAVALDTFWHSLLGVDEANRPVTPVITWEDTRSRRAAAELRAQLDERAVHERTGARFHASYWPAKLRWLAEEQSAVFARAAQWISFGEYVHRKFLGRSVCSLSMASATGMLTTRTKTWDSELMSMLGVQPEQLPRLGDLHESIQGLIPEYAVRWPALRDVLWFPALGDGATANIGSGCASTEHWALTIGTSSALRVVVTADRIVPPAGLWLYLVDARRSILGGALSEGGNLLAWLAALLQLTSIQEIDELVAAMQPDEHGLTVLPFIAGERSPGWHSEARLTITGISLHTPPTALLRAGMEALAYQIRSIYEQLHATLRPTSVPTIVASGGTLLNSAVLRNIVADTLGAAIYSSQANEASARGAALLALESLGLIADVAQIPPLLGQPSLPDAKRGEIYKKAARRQYELYGRLLS
ncbi:MAG: gluconokinase [Ktedonobacteraceae bacterium]|nr:gluconokinase [Ktedonobacteraceae bacterium]